MRVRPEELPARLERGLAPIYVVSGDEPLQLEESVDAIRAAARARGFTERIPLHADAGFDWSELAAHQASLSLFSERRLIDLRLLAKPGREGGEALKAYAARPAEETVLLVVGVKLDRNDARSAWYRALDAAGVTVQVWPVGPRQLPGWIRARARALGLELDAPAAAAIAERVEGNLLAGRQELEKLRLLHGAGRIGLEAVVEAVADSARYGVFELADTVLAGDAARARRMVRGLEEEGTPAPVVVWALARELRGLAPLARAVARGERPERALAAARVWERRRPLVGAALRRLGPERCLDLIEEAAAVDRVVKGAPGDPWDAIERLALGICGVSPVPAGPPG